MKKILAPTDFSELSKLGIRRALEMARDISAEVIVYHAVDVGVEWKTMHAELRSSHDVIDSNRKVLDKFLSDHFADCMALVEVRQVIEFGAPHKNIVEVAERENVDMIVMSTHGRTGIDHVILGSVTEKVVARAPCPVLVVPRGERRTSTRSAA
jgi:nucleotide-binding universal stress UspA family protein